MTKALRRGAYLVFAGTTNVLRAASLRDLRFHDLRHTFGTQVIGNPRVSILQLKEWMGHADIDRTMKYLRYAPRAADGELVAEAFGGPSVASSLATTHRPDR
jgi:integrase